MCNQHWNDNNTEILHNLIEEIERMGTSKVKKTHFEIKLFR